MLYRYSYLNLLSKFALQLYSVILSFGMEVLSRSMSRAGGCGCGCMGRSSAVGTAAAWAGAVQSGLRLRGPEQCSRDCDAAAMAADLH